MLPSVLKKIHYKDASVAIISPLSQIRLPILKSLKKSGFKKISIYKSLEDYQKLDRFQSEWIITQLFSGKTLNALSFARNQHEQMRESGHRMTLILGREEAQVIPEAFSYGVLSWLNLDEGLANESSFEEQVGDFLKKVRQHIEVERGEVLLAASYLRSYLKKEKLWFELLDLENILYRKFPRLKDCAINLVEACFLAGEYQQGRIKFDEICQMFPGELDDDIKRIREVFPNALIADEKYASRYNISNVVVVESDQSEMIKVENALQKLGIDQFHPFSSYREAWDYLKSANEPDLLIMEWTRKKKDLHREQFAQRVRGKGFINVPMVILVSNLTPPESNLISDIQALQLINKPLREKDLLMSLAYAIQQFRAPDERKPIEYKIEQSLKSGNIGYALHLRKKLLRNANVSLPRKYYMESLFYYYEGHYERCRNLLIKGIKLSVMEKKSGDIRPNTDKTILLAKCLNKLGDRDLAIQMLEKARDRSPFNIPILIELAHMNYESGNMSAVEQSIERAESIDRESTQVINTRAKIALYSGEIKQANELLNVSEDITDIISSLNNQAVHAIRSGSFEKGIKLYQSALNALPKKHTDYLGVVNYNLSLAYLRKNLPEAGLKYLKQALSYPGSRIYQKANALFARVEKAISDNRPVNELLGKFSDTQQDLQAVLNIIVPELGESKGCFGLSGIYQPNRNAEYSQKLLTSPSDSLIEKLQLLKGKKVS